MEAAAAAVRQRGSCSVALAGGTTPKAVYALLAAEPWRSRVRWRDVRFFWGDERHVPPDDPESNFRMVQESMLSRLSIVPQQVWRIRGELPSADRAASEYEADLRRAFALSDSEMPAFDLVLLGLGADGHTASLFPRTGAVHERNRLVVSNRVASDGTSRSADRITLTPPVLNAGADVLFLVQGADKAGALQAVLEGPLDPDRWPAQVVRPVQGRVSWLVDASAAGLLSTVHVADVPAR